ncbi:hypothetical protein ACIQNU_31525 [Streptomyces sp. NPDC091292]|uniref:hypothetical protein n=1 Tax=Streptomyces sp. NPDC091292 TaxID=3365991 RepID=UPI0037F4FA4F
MRQTPTINRAITEWLARAHPTPSAAYTQWQVQGVAMLPLGRDFAAVRLPARLIHAAIGVDDRTDRLPGLRASITSMIGGPVIHDGNTVGVAYYALIPWHAGLIWEEQHTAPCVAVGTYLGVPRVDRLGPPGPYWVVPPSYDGHLCAPASVRALIGLGRERLSAEADT